MSEHSNVNRLTASLLGVLALSLGACTNLNRTATLNQSTHISGARAERTIQAQLARHGFSNASVSCARTINVFVGPAISCKLSGAGSNRTVRFTFRTLGGEIKLSSVTPS